jgi:hypothetical protein
MMPHLLFITGEAGTGKTTELLRQISENATKFIVRPHQRLLAMAVMHGARRRLLTSLVEHDGCRKIPRTVCTIDSFALDLVNKWRSALGLRFPITASKTLSAFAERHFRCHAPFEEILKAAVDLLASPYPAKVIGLSYPLIVIDEFQDCHGLHLELVKRLAELSQLMLAADEFQLLEGGAASCPAVEWAIGATSAAGPKNLIEQHRTRNIAILGAAHALRHKKESSIATVPVLYGGVPQLAWKIIERVLLTYPRGKGTFALISPTRDHVINSVLQSVDSQQSKRQLQPIRWLHQTSQEEDERKLLNALGVGKASPSSGWNRDAEQDGEHVSEVTTQVLRFAKLRGLAIVPVDLVTTFAQKIVHAHHAYPTSGRRCTITTVHGAKNREFDYVFVLWPYSVRKDEDLQRRLLYNAITRAKKECSVFALQKAALVKADPVLKLLGPAKPIFPPKPKSEKRKPSKPT